MDGIEGRRLIITGVVQGVGFRYHMTREALRLGVKGWARNRRDGSVEAHIVGTPETIAAMIEWSKRGPPAASVTQVLVEEIKNTDDLDGFCQRQTE